MEVESAALIEFPMRTLDQVREHRDAILRLAAKYGIAEFGFSVPWLGARQSTKATLTS